MATSVNVPKRPTEFGLSPSPPRKRRRTPSSILNNTQMDYDLAEVTIRFDQLAWDRDNMAVEQEALDKRLEEKDLEFSSLRW
ncbi:hypothetical protein N7481_000214 [Penicillium waksmanii]|uniref:uncharacterized protein n=1 Tax=Penicillium waksmanii TaxID=69791 RepID=UPI00254971E8|nr:uncharacterized protein N7481_000214 [Penicillium waksmanii]KAJ5999805.1 hypothetical protein N7481_000214 [Penicillium waksmanii]